MTADVSQCCQAPVEIDSAQVGQVRTWQQRCSACKMPVEPESRYVRRVRTVVPVERLR